MEEARGDGRPLECALMNVKTFKVLTRLKLEADPDEPAVVTYRGLFYIFYRKHGDIYCSLIRPKDGKVILDLPITSTRISESHPMAVSSGKGVLVAWFERATGSLGLALVRERRIVWVRRCLITGVRPRRYGMAYLPGAGFLLACELVKEGGGVGALALVDPRTGRLIWLKSGLPDVSWNPKLGLIEGRRVTYASVDGLYLVEVNRVKGPSLLASLEATPFVGEEAVVSLRSSLYVITPHFWGNNTLSIKEVEMRTLKKS